MENFTTPDSEKNVLKQRLLRYFRAWPLFLISVATCFFLAFLYLLYSTPSYKVSSTLLIKDDKKESGQLQNNNFAYTDLFRDGHNMDNEVEVLKSKKLLRNTLEDLSLQTTYYVQGKLNKKEIYGQSLPVKVVINKLNPSAYEQNLKIEYVDANSFTLDENGTLTPYEFGKLITKPYGSFYVKAVSPELLREQPVTVKFNDLKVLTDQYEDKNLSVTPVLNKMAKVITLTFTSAVPQKGADILNKLIEVYKKDALNDKNLLASSTIQFIDERLKYLTTELTNVEKSVELFKRQNSVTDINSNAQGFVEQSTTYNRQLSEGNIQVNLLQSIENYLNKPGNQFALVPSSLGIQDVTLTGLISKFNDFQLERERLLRTVQPNNPLVVNIDGQLASLKTDILENLKNIKSGLQISLNNLRSNSSNNQSKIHSVPLIERELQEIKREQGIKEGLYLYLLQKREESALSLAANNNDIRITDPPTIEDKPVSPKPTLIYLCAFWMGILIPMSSIFVKDLFNSKIRVIGDVEANTTVPILGEISHNYTSDNVVVVKSRSMIAELFNLVRTNLKFKLYNGEKVVLVTSSMGGEGKTFFALNLAASLAALNKKVIILDFDLRKPTLLNKMGVTHEIGIADYLTSDTITFADIIKPSNIHPSLSLIGSGYISPNPAEIIASSKTEKLINYLKENYDHIIIDSSPIGQVADAFSLSPFIDCCIYLLRYNYTFISQLEILNNIYKNEKLKNLMILLNDAKKNNFKSYGYGYEYKEPVGTLVVSHA